MVAALAGLATLTERPGPVLDLTEQNQFLGDIANTLTRLSDDHNALLTLLGTPAQSAAVLAALADFGTELARIAARPELVLDLNTVSQQLDSLVATQSNQLDQVLATLGQPAQEAMLARTAAQVSQLAQRLDSLGDSLAAGPDLSPLVDQFAAGIAMLGQPAQNAAMLAALADLTEQVAIVAERPDPVIDMTAQRQSFAQFGTALGLAVQRLEAVADSVVDGRTAAPDLAAILAQLDALRADLPKMATDAATAQTLVQFSDQIAALAQHPDHGPAILAELADLAGQLAGLTRDVAQTPDILGPVQRLQAVVMAVPNAVSAQLATHVAQPAPVLDLSDLRADFARFAATLAEAVLRLENVARQVAAETPIVVTQITALQDDIALQRHDMVRRDDWAALSLNLATLVDRTDPAPDIAEHKLHMSAFAQGLAELVQWLEPVTRDLAAGPDFGPIVTEFDLLRAELNTATRDSAVEASFAHLSDQIADLAKSPDGLVSLTEQRRSFASFSNALAFMLHRLEAQGHATQTVTPHPDLTTDADDRLNHMVQNLSTPAGLAQGQTQADQGSSLSRLVLRLEHLLDKLDPPQTPLAPMPVPPGINPAQMVENLSTATTALAHVVNLLETAAGLSGQSPAASVADLFDRLDTVLNRHDLRDIAGNPALTEAIHDLIFAVHGSADTPMPSGQQAERLLHLRVDFAELMARALQAQSETTLPCP